MNDINLCTYCNKEIEWDDRDGNILTICEPCRKDLELDLEAKRAEVTCKICKGKGFVLVQTSEYDVEKDICTCQEVL